MIWPFKSKEVFTEVQMVVPESIKPPDGVIEHILLESYIGTVPAQWCNWAADQLGEPQKYLCGQPYTVKSFWVLYEACKSYKEGTRK